MANAIRDLVESAPADAPALIALDAAGERRDWTFGELAAATQAAQALLTERGVGRGDIVYTMCGSRIEFVLTLLACLRMGAVAAPCSPMLRAHDLEMRAAAGRPRLVVVADEHLPEIAAAGLGDVLPLSEWSLPTGVDVGEPIDLSPDDQAFLLFTSGSTGTPKPVRHLQSYVLGQRLQAEHWLGARPGDVVWSTAAPGWSKSTRNTFVAPWLQGAVAVIDEARFDPARRLKVAHEVGVTVWCMAPTEWRRMLAVGDFTAPPALRRLVAAGEPLDVATIERWRDLTGLTIADGYGQTETGHISGVAPGESAPYGSAGRPLPGVVTRLHQGELQVDATTLPTLCEVGPDELVDGRWWATGDLFDQDDDGFLFFRSRVDDVILSSGYRIDPAEVEAALRTHPAVRDCMVAGVTDAERGQVVAALVVAEGSADEHLAEALRAHVRAVTAPYKYPRVVRFVAELPRTTTGKAARGEGRQLLS